MKLYTTKDHDMQMCKKKGDCCRSRYSWVMALGLRFFMHCQCKTLSSQLLPNQMMDFNETLHKYFIIVTLTLNDVLIWDNINVINWMSGHKIWSAQKNYAAGGIIRPFRAVFIVSAYIFSQWFLIFKYFHSIIYFSL